MTTTLPVSDESASFPFPFRRLRSKSTGLVTLPFVNELATFVRSFCTTFQTSRTSSDATSPTDPI